LLFTDIENGGAIAQAPVVSLPIQRRGVVNLEKEFEQLPVADQFRIEGDLNRLSVRAVIAVGRIAHIAARVAHACRDDAGIAAQQILDAQKQPPARMARSVGADM